MAEATRMTAADVVAKVMAGEHGDFVRDAVALVARELMEAEISEEVGAERGEVSRERLSHRNGYRSRPWETRVGEIELLRADFDRRRVGITDSERCGLAWAYHSSARRAQRWGFARPGRGRNGLVPAGTGSCAARREPPYFRRRLRRRSRNRRRQLAGARWDTP
jgi:hypothetical protein